MRRISPRPYGWRLVAFRVLGFLVSCYGIYSCSGHVVCALASRHPVPAELWGALGMADLVSALLYLPSGGVYTRNK
jgi:hypothetical protein